MIQYLTFRLVGSVLLKAVFEGIEGMSRSCCEVFRAMPDGEKACFGLWKSLFGYSERAFRACHMYRMTVSNGLFHTSGKPAWGCGGSRIIV